MANRNELRRFAGDSIYNFIRYGMIVVIGLLTSVFLARGLGVKGQGIYALVLLLPRLVVNLGNFGISQATIYYVAHGDYSYLKSARANILISLLVSIFALGLGWSMATFWRDFLFSGAPLPYLMLALAIIPLNLINDNLNAIFQGLQDFKTFNIIRLLPETSTMLLVFLFVWVLRLGVWGALAAYITAYLITTIYILIVLQRRIQPETLFKLEFDFPMIRQLAAYGFPAYLFNILSFLNYRSDKFLLNMLAGTASLGLYEIAVAISEKIWSISSSVSLALLPRVASMEQSEHERTSLTLLVTRNVFILNLILGVIAYLVADWGIVFLYGESYREAAAGLKLLLPGIIMLGSCRVLIYDLAGRGKPMINTALYAISFIVNLSCNLYLIPRMGLRGASISSSISYSLNMVMQVIVFCRLTGSRWNEVVIPTRSDLELWKKMFALLRKKARASLPNS